MLRIPSFVFCNSLRLVATTTINIIAIVIFNSKVTLKRDTFLCQTSKRNNAKFEYILIYIFRIITTVMVAWKVRQWKNIYGARENRICCCPCTMRYGVWCARVPFSYVLHHAFLLLTIKTGINVSTSLRIWSEAMFAAFTWNLNGDSKL